jgi:hypothetical protein
MQSPGFPLNPLYKIRSGLDPRQLPQCRRRDENPLQATHLRTNSAITKNFDAFLVKRVPLIWGVVNIRAR